MTTTDVNELVDKESLAIFLKSEAPHLTGDFEVARIGEGQSCLTFSVKGADGWEVILRRPPRGDLPPTAFDVTREFAVMKALSGSGSSVPVATPIVLCEDKQVIGAPFYLMERVDGVVVRQELPDQLSSESDRWRMGEQLIDTLVELHAVDYASIGLSSFGKPDGYLERQLKRMGQLWELARSREIPDLEATAEWLGSNIPQASGSSIVHGDYKLDNVILDSLSPARIVAVVDWEISTLGDPLADLGWLLFFWGQEGDKIERFAKSVTHLPGFMRRKDLFDRYQQATGRDIDNILWYVALAGWKIAIIMEGSYRRYLAGIADHPTFALLDKAVPALAERALSAARGEFEL